MFRSSFSLYRKGLNLGLACYLLLSSASCHKQEGVETSTHDGNRTGQKIKHRPHVPNELLVKFKEGVSEPQRLRSMQFIQGSVREHVRTKTMQRMGYNQGIYRVQTPLMAFDALEKLNSLDEVEYAEPNYILTADYTANDPSFTNGVLWGMCGATGSPSNIFGSRAATAWTNGNIGSASVIVGVIDEGIMNTHPDLISNCWVNPFDPVDGLDNDGNGYIDDVYGWDFNMDDNTTFDGTDIHGTHVAGTIGAKGGNNTGVAGMCWNVKMISAKFLGPLGGTTLGAIRAIDYITDLKIRHNLNIVATNNSWGGGAFSQFVKDAIDRANVQNILFVTAAGNAGSNNDITPVYPANYNSPNIISVASITSNGSLSSFSCFGSTKVHLGAPGSDIYSTIPGATGGKGKKGGSGGSPGYGYLSGTSMATPHVTGAVVLYASKYPGSTAAQIKAAILAKTISTGSLTGKCITGGRLDVSGY